MLCVPGYPNLLGPLMFLFFSCDQCPLSGATTARCFPVLATAALPDPGNPGWAGDRGAAPAVCSSGLRPVEPHRVVYQQGMALPRPGRDHLQQVDQRAVVRHVLGDVGVRPVCRSEEHTSELQSLMRIYSAVFCLN